MVMRTRAAAPAFVLTATMLLGGCSTELVSEPVVPGPAIQSGMAYHLPMTRHELTLTRQIRKCPAPDNLDSASTGSEAAAKKVTTAPESWLVVGLDYKSAIEEKTVRDPHHTYRVNYEKMRKWNKTSEVTIKINPDGTLASFNASADDKSAEIAKNVISTVGKIAMSVAGVPTVPAAERATNGDEQPSDRTVEDLLANVMVCNQDVKVALQQLAMTEKTLKQRQSNVKTATGTLERRRLAHAQTPTSESAEALQAAITGLEKAQSELEALVQARMTFVDRIKDVRSKVVFDEPPKSENNGEAAPVAKERTEKFDDGTRLRRKWLVPLTSGSTPNDEYEAWREAITELDDADRRRLENFLDPKDGGSPYTDPFAVSATMTLRAPGTVADPTKPFEPNDDERTGLYYRIAAPIRIEVTCGKTCDAGKSNPTQIQTHDAEALQYGARMVLPFGNGAFQSNELDIVFGKNGVPTEITYKETKAAGVAASKVAEQAVDEFRARRDELRQKDRRETQLETLDTQAEADLVEAQTSLEEARNTLAIAPSNGAE